MVSLFEKEEAGEGDDGGSNGESIEDPAPTLCGSISQMLVDEVSEMLSLHTSTSKESSCNRSYDRSPMSNVNDDPSSSNVRVVEFTLTA